MNKQEIFEQMETLWETFTAEHAKPTASSDGKARKAIGEIKKLVTSYRAASVAEGKK